MRIAPVWALVVLLYGDLYGVIVTCHNFPGLIMLQAFPIQMKVKMVRQ